MSKTGLVFVVPQKTKHPILKKLKTSWIINLAVEALQKNLGLKVGKNATYPTRVILFHPLNTPSCLGSINHISTSSRDTPTEGAVRCRLNGLEDVQEKVNAMLKGHILKTLPSRPRHSPSTSPRYPTTAMARTTKTSLGPKQKRDLPQR